MELKYTAEQESELINLYNACGTHEDRENVILKFMGKHGKSKKSVIAKLSKSGQYIPKPKISKVTGEKPETKEQMVQKICFNLGLNELEGLDKAPKLTLQRLLSRLNED